MVSPRLFVIPLVILGFFAGTCLVEAQTLVYHLEHEWVRVWINQDGTVDLLYDITIVCDAGELHWVEIGQPTEDFTVDAAFDENDHLLPATDTSSGSDYKVRVDVLDLPAGESIRFNLTTNVARMIWEDGENPGNVGLQFTPSWFPVRIDNLRVRVITPPGVTESTLRTLTGAPWNSSDYDDGSFAVFWERFTLAPNEEYRVGVSFPKQFVTHYEVRSSWLETYGPWVAVFAVVSLVIALVAIALRKKQYLTPVMSIEALGIRRGLTAVEASYVLEKPPKVIVTEILYSLLQKRAVWVTATEPSVTLRVLEPFSSREPSQLEGPALRYYEIDFLNAIKNDGTLDEQRLADTILFLQRSVEDKLRGYCRRDTSDYYRKIVDKAWTEVTQAGTQDLASQAYDEQLLWLLLDPNYQARTDTAFRDRAFEPAPLWFWYWYSYRQYHLKPTYEPNVDRPAQSGPPPKIPGAEFANNIATAVETTSNNIVANLEKFASAVFPAAAPPKASHKPPHRNASCVCACAACACACACVSCACACAGGGAG